MKRLSLPLISNAPCTRPLKSQIHPKFTRPRACTMMSNCNCLLVDKSFGLFIVTLRGTFLSRIPITSPSSITCNALKRSSFMSSACLCGKCQPCWIDPKLSNIIANVARNFEPYPHWIQMINKQHSVLWGKANIHPLVIADMLAEHTTLLVLRDSQRNCLAETGKALSWLFLTHFGMIDELYLSVVMDRASNIQWNIPILKERSL